MQKKQAKPFQIVLSVVSVVLLVLAIFVFSNADRKNTKTGEGVSYGSVSVWGTIPSSALTQTIGDINRTYGKALNASYTYVPIASLDQTLLEALSNDRGPDVLILPAEWLHRNSMRIAPIPYDPQKGGISAREFKDTFTQAGEIFLYPEGIMALPFGIDPLVMYWNRDLFTNAEIVSPPTYWKDILPLTAKLTKKKNLDILESTIALGEYDNISNAKDILSLMFLQVGSPITEVTAGGILKSVIQNNSTSIEKAVRFYVDFANPLKSSYSWNRSLPNSQDAFLANDLAMYLDFASAYPTIIAKNPRLNFDLAPVPQTDGQITAVTYGKVHGLAVMKKGKNVRGGYVLAKALSSKSNADTFVKAAGMAPMRKDLLAVPQSDAYVSILYSAGLRARAWIDPQPVKTATIFSRMINAVVSGKADVAIAVGQAHDEMTTLIDPN